MGDTKMFLFFPNVSTINAFVSGIVLYGIRSCRGQLRIPYNTIPLTKALIVETFGKNKNIFVSPIASFVNHCYTSGKRNEKKGGGAAATHRCILRCLNDLEFEELISHTWAEHVTLSCSDHDYALT